MRVIHLAGLAVVVSLSTRACGGSGSAAPSGPPTTGSAVSTSPAAPPATSPSTSAALPASTLSLSSGGSGTNCLIGPSQSDYAWYDVAWRSSGDLRDVRVDLGSSGVTTVGDAESVPLTASGRQLSFSGLSKWQLVGHLAGADAVDYADRQDVDRLTPAAGDAGLFLLHLRVGRQALTGIRPARLDELVVHFTANGSPGTATLRLHQTFRRKGPGC